jgi:hypothetical protein
MVLKGGGVVRGGFFIVGASALAGLAAMPLIAVPSVRAVDQPVVKMDDWSTEGARQRSDKAWEVGSARGVNGQVR